jgi:hypothetical protein
MSSPGSTGRSRRCREKMATTTEERERSRSGSTSECGAWSSPSAWAQPYLRGPSRVRRTGRLKKEEVGMKMARTILASLLFGTTIGAAHASQDVCFQPDNFVDFFRLTTINSDATNCPTRLLCPSTLVFGSDGTNYRIPTNNNYAIPLVGGDVSGFANNPNVGFVGLHGVNSTSFFGNHSDCTFTFSFNGHALGQVLSVSCNGRAPGIWTKTVMYHGISCTAAIPVPPPSAKALGRCPSDPSPC